VKEAGIYKPAQALRVVLVSSIVTIPDVYRFFLIFPPIFAEWLLPFGFFWIGLWRTAHQNAGCSFLRENEGEPGLKLYRAWTGKNRL